jgi:hypothetical protein
MRKIRSSVLVTMASGVAVAGLTLAACQHYGGPKGVAQTGGEPIPDKVDYNWDVRPILSQNCFQCHGNDPKNRKAGLRLDIGEGGAYEKLEDEPGKRAIVPGNPGRSEMFRRITSTDPNYHMPPSGAHKSFSTHDLAVVEKWIKQGAKYKQHWAYLPVKVVEPRKTEWNRQALNPIDRYVYATLKTKGMAPSAEADRETLINRVTLDLTGLPPTLQQVDAFVADKDPKAYERLVDRLLNSQEYAERQAETWLDVARYADSDGYLNDNGGRFQHPYRDWVISAFRRNLPYDKFVTWQLAGDKLPNATREQVLATGFVRAGKKSNEGGIIDEEYRVEYVNERTELVGKAFLGLTVGCAKCHDHKYDTISQADYYSMGGFFNSLDERGVVGGAMGPTQAWPTPTQARNLAAADAVTKAKWTAYQRVLAAARQRAAAQVSSLPADQRGAFLKASIEADTQAYFPLDSGYKASLEPLMLDPAPPRPGSPTYAAYKAKMEKLGRVPGGTLDRGDPRGPGAAVAEGRPGLKLALLRGGSLHRQPGAPGADGAAKTPGGPGGEHRPGMRGGLHRPPGESASTDGKGSEGHRLGPGRGPGFKLAGLKAGGPPAADGPGKDGPGKGGPGKGRRGGGDGGDGDDGPPPPPAGGPVRDPDSPRLAGSEVSKALRDLVAKGYTNVALNNHSAINRRQLKVGLEEDKLQWTPAGNPGGKPAFLNNAQFVPGVKGNGVLLKNTVFGTVGQDHIGQFDRTQPYTIDMWVKLRANKPYEEATILYNMGLTRSSGWNLLLDHNKLKFEIIHAAPRNQIAVESLAEMPKGKWTHVSVTYDGNSKAEGVKLYVDGKPFASEITADGLTLGAMPRESNSYQTGSYFGMASGENHGRMEMMDGAIDEVRMITRALTPLEIQYLQDPRTAAATTPPAARDQLVEIAAARDPQTVQAWKDLADARLAEQAVEAPILQLMVAGDQMRPRTNYILDRGLYNSYKGETPTQAVPRVFKWDDKLPRNRLGLAQWLFDPKHPLTSRVYVNRLWQGHFGNGIVQTVEDFGTQGSNPTHPELLDYLAAEFIRSGWDVRHMHKLMVMSATYRQSSNISREGEEMDPRNFLLARGPRYRLPAETIRDNALFASGLLVEKPGGDSVFPYQPPGVWDGAGVGVTIYPTEVPADELHRRSMYTYMKRNAPFPSLAVFDMPDRNVSSVARNISNTPLQALVLLNDVQFMEAYRKLAERVMTSTPDVDRQLVTLFRLGARRHPSAAEIVTLRRYLDAETADLAKDPDAAAKLLSNGVAPVDPRLDRARLAAMTMTAATVMNSPSAYTLR